MRKYADIIIQQTDMNKFVLQALLNISEVLNCHKCEITEVECNNEWQKIYIFKKFKKTKQNRF